MKSKLNDLKEQLIKCQTIVKGHKLNLYNHEYNVMDTNKSFTLLKDCNGTPLALPTKKLQKILRQNFMKSLNKAVVMNQNPGIIHGSDKGTSARTKESAGIKTGPGKMHAGKIRVDKVDWKGKKYHYWVDAQTGLRHDDHDSKEPSKEQISEETHKLHGQVMSAINSKTHPDDHGKLKKLLDSWVESKTAYHNLKEAHTQMARENKGAVPKSTLDLVANKQKDHLDKFKKLKDAMQQSYEKVKAGK